MDAVPARGFAARFIQDEKLLPLLFDGKWGVQRGRCNVDDPSDVPTVSDDVDLFDHEIRSVQWDRRTGLVALIILCRDPGPAAKWANPLVERVNHDLRQSRLRLFENQTKAIMFDCIRAQCAWRVIDPAFVPDADRCVWPKSLAIIPIAGRARLLGGLVIVAFLLRRELRRQ